MKIIKGILITLVILAVIITVIGFLSPRHVHVERSMTIKAPVEIVHAQINNLKNWNNWSPWYKMDTAMKMEYNTIAEGAGASFKWESKNKNVGSGDLTITSSTKDSIVTAMNFMENGTATGKFVFTKADSPKDSLRSGTKVTWTMESDMGMNPIGRIFGLFMDKMVGKDFEKGLAGIKDVAEATPTGPKKYRGYEVVEMDSPEIIFIGKKDSISRNKISEFYQKNLPAVFEAVKKEKLQPAIPFPSGLFFKWDTVNKITVMAAVMAVKGDSKTKVKGFETFVVPAGKTLNIKYFGGYNGIGPAHEAMDDYINEKGFIKRTPVREEYVTDPMTEKDSTKWLTNVIYPVK
ncbi:MAG: SRPBCC family protein [Bacteroidetes bacterium]|nr:SRPBCC family protein [Bacteroidota bacterium]